jgi:hypothetical protein
MVDELGGKDTMLKVIENDYRAARGSCITVLET